MARRPRYDLIYAPEALDHLDVIERKYHRLIQRAVAEQLRYSPGQPTRNRKPLGQSAILGATWELRCGPTNRFRVFYRIEQDERTVRIAAIGVKVGNRLFIGGKEMEL